MKRAALVAAVAAGLVALACGGAAPTAVDQPTPVAVTEDDVTVTASTGGKIPISGKIAFAGIAPPTRVLVTPGGITHMFDVPVLTSYTGDVAGDVTFTESWTARRTVTPLPRPVRG